MRSTRTVLPSCRLWTECDVVQALVEVPPACPQVKLEMVMKLVLVMELVKVFLAPEMVVVESEAATAAMEEEVAQLLMLVVWVSLV